MGRIGRATFKLVVEEPELELVAVNDLVATDNLAYLLQYDSVYGRYEKPVATEAETLIVEGEACEVLHVKDPAELPWSDRQIDIVFECTGIFRTREDLEKHLRAGAHTVILSAPAKSKDVPNVVHRVNQAEAAGGVLSCASCTTNCITPVVEVMGRRIGIQKAIMTTVHAFTSAQAIVDGPNKNFRRGRAGANNFVPTSTGAAKATTQALPQYEGKFNGIAIRGPVPVGSIADLVFVTVKPTSVEEVNRIFEEEAQTERYAGVLGVTHDPIVSSDIIGDPRASIVDLTMTQVVDGDLVKILSWYDNEWGYASQMVKEAVRLSTEVPVSM
jgi:glyceraldehyde 3-phosphate dehydrogenase